MSPDLAIHASVAWPSATQRCDFKRFEDWLRARSAGPAEALPSNLPRHSAAFGAPSNSL